MQTDPKGIYKNTAQRTGKPEKTYIDIGQFVFSALYDFVRRPSCLIIKVKGVGSWYLRKKKMISELTYRVVEPGKGREEFTSDIDYQIYCNRVEKQAIFRDRLKEYDIFTNEKIEARKRRNAHKVLYTFDKREDKGAESSENNLS